ncbi:hypothetical protein C5251_14710 [Salmonella enterica]|nr:hypothetical protein [Salmonella enterica]
MYEVKKNKACGVKTAGFFVKRHKKTRSFCGKNSKKPFKIIELHKEKRPQCGLFSYTSHLSG